MKNYKQSNRFSALSTLLIFATLSIFCQNVSANSCESFFRNSGDYSQLIKLYTSEAKATRANTTPNLFETNTSVEPNKLGLLKKHAHNIRSLITSGSISTRDLVRAKVFIAETYENGTYTTRFYFAKIGNGMYLFSLESQQTIKLGDGAFGVSQLLWPRFLRLDKEHILTADAETGIKAFPAKAKDPELVSSTIEGLKDENKKIFLRQFTEELKDILLSTDVTIQDFQKADLKIGKIKGTDTQVGYFVAANTQFYLTTKPELIYLGSDKNWGTFRISRPIGFSPNTEVVIEFENGMSYKVQDRIIQIPVTLKDTSFLFNTKSNEDTLQSQFHKRFQIKYHLEILDLIAKNYIESFNPNNLEIILSSQNSNSPELVLSTSKGFVLFKREGGWMRLEDISIADYGTTFYVSDNSMLVIRDTIGFTSKKVVNSKPTDNHNNNFEAFLVKIKVATGKVELNAEEVKFVEELLPVIGQMLNALSSQNLKADLAVITQIAEAALPKQSQFTKDELIEIIKLAVILVDSQKQ